MRSPWRLAGAIDQPAKRRRNSPSARPGNGRCLGTQSDKLIFDMNTCETYNVPTQILIVEDSQTFGVVLQSRLQRELSITVAWMRSYEECAALLSSGSATFLVALLDVNLPDAPRGEVVDLVLAHNIPVIILTGTFSDAMRDAFWAKHIVDYILKQSSQCIDYAVKAVRRIIRNKDLKCLVVDDSRLARHHVSTLLAAHGYTVLTAASSQEALDLLAKHRDVILTVTDYSMPEMDGVALTQEIRKSIRIDEMAVIGISSADNPSTSVLFLKNGANDYLGKAFQTEEFYCRVSLNLDTIIQFQTIKTLANTDFLTRLSNRRHLFESAEAAAEDACRAKLPIGVAMIDIDHFKCINDTYGHDAGDVVLISLAGTLRQVFGEDHIIGRIGGEEFCVVSPGYDAVELLDLHESLRRAVAESCVQTPAGCIRFTISIGLHDGSSESFETLLKAADNKLYAAKAGGRNKIIG